MGNWIERWKGEWRVFKRTGGNDSVEIQFRNCPNTFSMFLRGSRRADLTVATQWLL